ncbi:FecCD family ABC transporter permease [Sphingomonas jatrophae]|uniref:Iron complex transport system permease protein n=1 Tax=Sphingomonas jatrophae TaxID=1166337 RepID=A0A1I6JBU3_9SPHN|nr:iron ABC transporter permease [Sphingomonas jatrophae]SFR76406.1 iron complex transport system permease protein [Sphingomonas jatrophae]
MTARLLTPALVLLLIALASTSLLAGTVWLTPAQAAAALVDPRADLAQLVMVEVRLPRLVLALLVGGILGLSGAVLQGLLRNPLAEPGLLGVSSGASLGAVIAIYYGFAAGFTLATPLFALAGALATVAVALALGRTRGTLSLILAGIAVSAIAGAGVNLALNFAPSPYAAYEIMTWLMGSLVDRSWDHVALAAPFILVGSVLLFATARALDALALGEAQAESLGIHVRRTYLLALVGTALGVGAATAVTGAIGFVGLVAPHLVRAAVGQRPGATLLPATLAGAAIVLAADIATRLIRTGPEIKLGVFVAAVGAPFFLWLVLHVRRTGA